MELGELYKAYVGERLSADVIESDQGFVVYKIANGECFIVEFFVKNSERGKGEADSLLGLLEELARKSSCEQILAEVCTLDKGCSRTLRAALKRGFDLKLANNNVLLICKSLLGG